MYLGTRFRRMAWLAAFAAAPLADRAVSCTTQAELGSLDRDVPATVAGRMEYDQGAGGEDLRSAEIAAVAAKFDIFRKCTSQPSKAVVHLIKFAPQFSIRCRSERHIGVGMSATCFWRSLRSRRRVRMWSPKVLISLG